MHSLAHSHTQLLAKLGDFSPLLQNAMRCRWHAVARRPWLGERMLWIWATRFQRITEDWPLALNPRFLDNLSFFRASYCAEKFTLSRVKIQSEDFKELKLSASISQNPLRSQLNCARATAYAFQSSKLHGFLKERLQLKNPDGSFHDDALESSSTTSLWTHCIQRVYGGHLEYPISSTCTSYIFWLASGTAAEYMSKYLLIPTEMNAC